MRLAAKLRRDPLAFAKAFWPAHKPRAWQSEILGHISNHLSNPETRYKPCRVAVASGNGIGKSALIGMILTWGMTTCKHCRCKVTAGKAEQLETKTVPEVARWFKSSLAAPWFDVRAQSIRSLQTDQPEAWRIDFETWTEEKPDTFQGLHNHGRRIIMVFDEASAIADAIFDAAQTSLTDEKTELIWIVFGNPIRNSGRFRQIFGDLGKYWKTWQIDSRKVEGTSQEQANEWVEAYGEDSDWVRVHVRGEFPRSGSNEFISSEWVEAARKHRAVAYEHLPKYMAVDAARYGDDKSVIGVRQGRKFRILAKYRGKDTAWVGEEVIRFMREETPIATIIDCDGLGVGVFDHLKYRGFTSGVYEFHGGAVPKDPATYYNKRTEVWGLARSWLKSGAEIPNDTELAADLIAPTYGFSNKGQLQLERKQDMKKRLLRSPDCGDTLAMTFAEEVFEPPYQKPEYRQWEPKTMETSWMG